MTRPIALAFRRLAHATQGAALGYQDATDERDQVIADGIDRLIQAAGPAERADRAAPARRFRRAGSRILP